MNLALLPLVRRRHPCQAFHKKIQEINVSIIFLTLVYSLYASIILILGISFESIETWSYWSISILMFYLVLDIVTDRMRLLIAAKIMIWFGTGALSIFSVLSLLAWMKLGSAIWLIGVVVSMLLALMLLLAQVYAGKDRLGSDAYFHE